jgi:putative heme-binding domain-containing protein
MTFAVPMSCRWSLVVAAVTLGMTLGVTLGVMPCGSSTSLAAEDPPSAVGPLLKLFQSGRLPAERQATVVEMICKRGNEHDLRVVFDKVARADGFPADLRKQAMAWLADAATTRKLKPAGDLAALGGILAGEASRDAALQAAAIRLASTWKDVSVAPALRTLAMDAKAAPAMRRVAIEGLVAIGDPASREALARLASPGQPFPLRSLAIAGLAGFDLDGAATAAAKCLGEATAQEDPAELVAAFLNRKDGPERLAHALGQQALKPDVAKVSLRYMYSVGHSDAALTEVLSKAAGIVSDAPPPTPEEVAKLADEVVAKGDPARGEAIFRRKDLSCMKCHSVSRAGGQVGPELSAVGGSSPTDYIVNSILNPNLAVKEQYVTRVFELSSGKVLTGIVIDRDDVRVNVRDVNGQTITIPTADIDDEAEGRSLMPQGLTMFLTRSELVDLARFVSELGKPGPYAVQQTKRIQRWRVLRAPADELVNEVPHVENLRQFVFGAPAEQWLPAYGKVNGALPLSEIVDAADWAAPGEKPRVLILQGEINVSDEGPVRFSIDSSAPFQAWVAADSIESKREATVTLPVGRHPITLRVEVAGKEKPELKVECATPDGATTNFEVVGGA